MSIRTDEKAIEVLLEKGVENVFPSKEYLTKRLLSGDRLRIYFGIDPTGPTLHLGHTIALRKLRHIQQLGHEVVLLIGDFTAMIGDPTGKLSTRVQLTREEVLANAALYKEQASKFLSFEGDNPAVLMYNSTWLGVMNFEEVLSLASHMTVQEMLKRDMFEERIKEEKPIYIHEFLYPLMQGYDSVSLDTDGEIGGNDQTFNMLTGRELSKKMNGKEKFVLAMKLLVDPTGKKMGKSEGNMITLTDTASDMFGKVMSWTDDMILTGFELCTEISLDELKYIEGRLRSGENPRNIKAELALMIVEEYYGKEAAHSAEEQFNATFTKGEIPSDIEEIYAEEGNILADLLLEKGIISSKSDFRRLVDQGSITDMKTREKITSYTYRIEKDYTFKIGKKRFIQIRIK